MIILTRDLYKSTSGFNAVLDKYLMSEDFLWFDGVFDADERHILGLGCLNLKHVRVIGSTSLGKCLQVN